MSSRYVGLVLGLWYLVAPFVWGYPFGFLWWHSVVLGGAILAITLSFYLGVNRLSGWLLIATGAYSMFAPFVHDYLSQSFPLWNDLFMGIAVVGTGVAMAGAGLEYSREASARA
ncbi:MAG: SPW repeat domain-containing protein [Gemmatimonadota bacterium]